MTFPVPVEHCTLVNATVNVGSMAAAGACVALEAVATLAAVLLVRLSLGTPKTRES